MFLIDTVTLSELRRRERDPMVVAWFERQRTSELYLSVISIGEIERGIVRQRAIDPAFADALAAWLDRVLTLYGAADSLAVGQKMSEMVYGHDIKHVMLLHIGGFETVMLPKLLDLLKEKNFKLITLQEAESDPAYATDADLPGNWGGAFLQQMMRVKHLEFPPSEDRLAKLDAVCR